MTKGQVGQGVTGTSSDWRRPVISFGGLLVAYYAMPTDFSGDAPFVAGLVVTVLAVIVLGWTIAVQLRRQVSGNTEVRLQTLLILIEMSAVVFALGFYWLERARPGEISGLHTKTDSLYFTVTTMTTVGYGDIHAAGQIARVVVLVQIAFNVVFVGSLVRMLSGQAKKRAEQRRR
ncbi:potassium channel family protein [Kribbella sp. NPDC054772]